MKHIHWKNVLKLHNFENPPSNKDPYNASFSLHVMNKSTANRSNARQFTIIQGYPIYIAGQWRKICGLLQMYARYVAIWLTSYGVKKYSLNKR